MNIENKIWIALIELRPLLGNTYISMNERAYTNLILYATNYNDYNKKALVFLKSLNFEIVKIEDVKVFSDRAKEYLLDNSLYDLVENVILYKKPQISNLHVFEED